MIQSLYRRLALILLLMFIILGVILFWLYESSNQQLQRETSQKIHLHLAEYLVEEIKLFDGGELDHDSVKEAFSKVMRLDPGTELYVIDEAGHVMAYDAPPEKIIRKTISLLPIKKFIENIDNIDNIDALPILGDDPRSDKQKIFSAAPIYDDNNNMQSYLYIIIKGEAYDDVTMALQANKTWWTSLGMMGAGMIFLLLTALLLFNKLTQPLVRLSREVASFEKSNFTVLPEGANKFLSSENNSHDEFQHLQQSFYRMAQHIIDQLGYLKKHDDLRSEFLAHVSHDLRTPLAGVRAYLETLQLKGKDLSEAARQDFLDKALVTNNRLSKMIDELFELARLEYGEVEIKPEIIYLSDLLSDMYATLSNLAAEKDIKLQVNMERDDLTIYADVARLDRILQNLVANAIQYTPEKGQVTIDVKQLNQLKESQDQAIKISIKDTGQGIAEEDLPYIFEPYFRSKSGRRMNQEGKGLGLAITSGLLKLHGSQLLVESHLNQGSEFSFVLKLESSVDRFLPSLSN